MLKVILSLGLALILAGCGSTSEDNNENQSTGNTATEEATENVEQSENDEVSEGKSEDEDIGYRFIENTDFLEEQAAKENEIRKEWEDIINLLSEEDK